ncbi:RNA/RNP complex-1-interacting phosphatase-like [Glandiceps talaboti]
MAMYRERIKRSMIPEGWRDYSNVGDVVKGTRIVAFKVPLKEDLMRSEDISTSERFGVSELFKTGIGRKLGLVIDLTNTSRYYNSEDITSRGVGYKKIKTEGHAVPGKAIVSKFKETVDDFLERNKGNDKLIGVHCTHGVNRSGYMIGRYLIDNRRMTAEARGYGIDRVNYLDALRNEDVDEYDHDYGYDY